jgi:cytoskeletal protein CcmA (bactofilin family)
MSTSPNVGHTYNSATLDQVSPDGLLVDLGERFEEWLRSLGTASICPSSNTSPTRDEADTPLADFYLESSAGSACEVSFEGVLYIEGQLAGNIRSLTGTLVMPEQVMIEADIGVGVALINGRVNGNITASRRVVLQSQARVEGNISTPSLSIKDGAIFEGECALGDCGTESSLDSMNTEESGALSFFSA